MAARDTVYALVSFGPDDSVTSHLVRAIATEALADDQWRGMYDAVTRARIGYPEDTDAVTRQHSELPADVDRWMTLYGSWWLDPKTAVVPLMHRAQELGVNPRSTVCGPELVAAAVGAQWWCAATAVVDLMRAPSLGNNAVRSMSAVLSRACGYGPVVSPVTAADHPAWLTNRLDPYIDHAYTWAHEHLSEPQARWALLAACADLSWQCPRPTATTVAAAYARQRLADRGI